MKQNLQFDLTPTRLHANNKFLKSIKILLFFFFINFNQIVLIGCLLSKYKF